MGRDDSNLAPALTPGNLKHAKPALRLPRYERAKVGIGIAHIGPGAFHRVHQAFYVDEILARDPRWGISAISLQTAGVRDALSPQGGLYTLALLDEKPTFRLLGAIQEVLVAPESPAKVLARLAGPRTQVVTVTVTEKGYCLDGAGNLNATHPAIRHDWANRTAPQSLIGYLAEALRRRRANGSAPFAVISCDNLCDNGTRLKNAVVHFARDVDRDLAQWIEGEVAFPCTMVDSITPATDEALRARVAEATGLIDAWPVQRETFTQWVIEDMPGLGPDWETAGVTLTHDVTGYERAKLRLLNGAHSSLAYLGLLKGYETVAEAMCDPALASFIRTLMIEDVAPIVRAPKDLDIAAYIEDILRRFRNAAVRHQLAQIAWDGSQKLPVRLLPTITENLITGRPIARLCLPVAAWMRFVRRQIQAGRPLVDPLATAIAQCASANSDAAGEVARLLSLSEVFQPALTGNAEFRARLIEAYAALG